MAEPAAARSDTLGPRTTISPLGEVRAAITFLTRLPVRREADDLDRTGAAAFGIIGSAIGLVGAVPIVALGERLPVPAAVLALLVMVLVTGGLHLDGLADTADALAAPTPDAADRARTDPRAGPAGVTAIVLDLLLGASLLAAIAAADTRLAAAALVVAGAASRAATPIAARTLGWRRSEPRPGLGAWFVTRLRPGDVAAAIATTLAVTALAAIVTGDPTVPIGAAGGLVVASLVSSAIVSLRGGLDGDGYGAIVEIVFVAVLAGIAVQIAVP